MLKMFLFLTSVYFIANATQNKFLIKVFNEVISFAPS